MNTVRVLLTFPVLLVLAACDVGPVQRATDGALIARGDVDGDGREGRWTLFHDGARVAGRFAGGAATGIWKELAPDGRLVARTTLRGGRFDGEAARWHGNGALAERGGYRAGVREGAWLFLREDGSVDDARTGHYRAGTRIE